MSRRFTLVSARGFATVACLAATSAAGGLATSGLGCGEQRDPRAQPASSVAAPTARTPAEAASRARLALIRARFALPATLSAGRASRDAPVRVELPSDADRPVLVTDVRSGIGVAVSLEGGRAQPILRDGADAFYRGAAPGGGDVLHRASDAGDEDFVYFAARPEAESLRYRVGLRGSGVVGLRLVERTLEVLDASGAPRLRVLPPAVLDASGRAHPATLAVEGCAYDTSPRAPWGRPVAPPGASSCVVVVSWQSARIAYPALVDPSWVTTTGMLDARGFHALAPLPSLAVPPTSVDRVLITGGFDVNGQPLASVEIYEPLSQTFAVTSSMSTARAAHTATAIPGSTTGQVLLAGGSNVAALSLAPPEQLGAATATTELYDEATGLFTPGPALGAARALHTATSLVDGRILLAGGALSATADVYTPGAGGGTIAPASTAMHATRRAHAAALLSTGAVLLTGGVDQNGNVLQTSEKFCPANDCSGFGADYFQVPPTSMTTPRAFHTATALANGDVLLAGGISSTSTTAGQYLATAELFSLGAFTGVTIPMTSARAYHSATGLAPGLLLAIPTGTDTAQALLIGGFDGNKDLASAEAFFPTNPEVAADPALRAVPSMSVTRRHAATILVNQGGSIGAGNGVLACGGISGSTNGAGAFVNGAATASAELFFKVEGDPCQSDGECVTGHCAYGVCCDTACGSACFTCVASLKQPGQPSATVDGVCGYTVAGYAEGITCDATSQIETHYICDGSGNRIAGPDSRDCKPSPCGANNRCSTFCDNGVNQCASNGWCDFSQPPDAGVEDAGTGGGGTGGGSSTDGGADAGDASTGGGSAGDGGSTDAGTGDGGPDDAGGDAGPIVDAGSILLGTCQLKGNPSEGATCTADSHCNPPTGGDAGLCVDGYCCDSLCGDQCQACDVVGTEGKCSTVGTLAPEPVHDGGLHPREACAGGSSACAGLCAGNATMCTYPDGGVVEQALDCAESDGAVVKTTYPCNGAGADTPTQGTCGGFGCLDAHTCRTSCTADTECITDHVCIAGACMPLVGSLCDGVVTLRRTVAAGGNEVCPNHYACPANATACDTSCLAVQDCAQGYVCDETHTCVPPLAAPTLPSCTAGRPLGATPSWLALALVSLVTGLARVAGRRRAGSRET